MHKVRVGLGDGLGWDWMLYRAFISYFILLFFISSLEI